MAQALPNTSLQELDLQLFLTALGITLPAPVTARKDGYAIIRLSQEAAEFLETRDKRAVVLCYRHLGCVYPLSLLFLRGAAEVTFCHSTMLLDSYAGGPHIADMLRQALRKFFSQAGDRLLAVLEPAWTGISLAGQLDCRIKWAVKPELQIVAGLMLDKFGTVREIPCFPGVYYYNNPYEENLLEVALPELNGSGEILVLGTGAGLEAMCIALLYGVPVDATDINPVAVANTQATARRAGVDRLVSAWSAMGLLKSGKDMMLFYLRPHWRRIFQRKSIRIAMTLEEKFSKRS